MLKWFPIRKRKANAFLYGTDVGMKPIVKVTVHREEDLRLPKPKFKLRNVNIT